MRIARPRPPARQPSTQLALLVAGERGYSLGIVGASLDQRNVCSTESCRWAPTSARSSERMRSALSAARLRPSRRQEGAKIKAAATSTPTPQAPLRPPVAPRRSPTGRRPRRQHQHDAQPAAADLGPHQSGERAGRGLGSPGLGEPMGGPARVARADGAGARQISSAPSAAAGPARRPGRPGHDRWRARAEAAGASRLAPTAIRQPPRCGFAGVAIAAGSSQPLPPPLRRRCRCRGGGS